MPLTRTWLPGCGECRRCGQPWGCLVARRDCFVLWAGFCQLGPHRPTLTAPAPTAAPPHPTPCSKANPQAFGNVLRRMLEAAGRGMWNADAATLEKLQRMYAELDDELEGIQR